MKIIRVILISVFILSGLYTGAQSCQYSLTALSTASNSVGYIYDDFNGDGKTDIVEKYPFYLPVTSHMQVAGNTFTTVTGNAGSASDWLVVSGDFNNDGKKDIAGATYMYYGLGNGSFTFSLLTQPLTGSWGQSVDVNNDGNKDIISALSGGAYVFLGSGTGNFSAPVTYTVPSVYSITNLVVADYNNNSIPDFLTAKNNGTVVEMDFYSGNGNGTFALANTFTVANLVYGYCNLKTADFNNDGNMDLAYSNPTYMGGGGSNTLKILYGAGNGTFSGINYNIRNFYFDVADVNSDGKRDITCITKKPYVIGTNDSIITYFNNGIGGFIPSSLYIYTCTPVAPQELITRDLNNDLIVDCAVPTWSPGFSHALLFGNNDCIYPGDANADGVADNVDILEIGLRYGQVGAVRTPTGNLWNSYAYTPWIGTVSTGKNLANADCNGDGAVNASDTLAVFNNYANIRTARLLSTSSVSPQLNIIPDQPIVNAGNWGTSSIYIGDASNPINNIHGIAFTATYDNLLLQTDSVYIEYIPSFINSGQNLDFRKKVFSGGQLYTATTHTNGIQVNGNGKVAILHYKIKPSLISDSVLNVGLTGAYKLEANGTLSTLTTGTGTLLAKGLSTGIGNHFSQQTEINLFPNPAGMEHMVAVKDFFGEGLIEVVDLNGKIIRSFTNTNLFSVSDIPSGLYIVHLREKNKPVRTAKLVICN